MGTLSTTFMILQGLGLWAPYHFSSKCTRLLYKFYTFILMSGVFFHCGTGIIGLILTGRSLLEIANYGCRLLSSSITWGKMLNLILYRKTIISILETLETDPCLPRDDAEISIQNEHNRNVRNISIQYCIVMNLTISLMISNTILQNIPARELPRRAWFPWDYSYGTMYWSTCIFQVINIIYLYSTIFSYDTLVCGMFLEISTKLNILQYRFKNLDETFKRKIDENNFDTVDIPLIEKNLIIDCVKCHLCLFNLAKRVNSTFGLIIFLQYVISTAILCLSIYNISGMQLNTGFLFLTIYLFNMLFEIFLYCACANEVTIASENIAKSVFAVDWMNFTRTTWKSAIIIGCQACRPIIFRSGYFVTLSLDSFKSLIKVAYSVYNALTSLH